MQIGMIGLGAMGKPIARHLHRGSDAFIAVTGNDRTRAEFMAEGVSVSGSLTDLASADILFMCLPNGDVNWNTLFGSDALASQLKGGAVVVDLGTTAQSATLQTAEALAKLGVSYLDAPISGLASRAEEGTLTIMCGGDERVFEQVRPYFELFGTEVLLMGGTGAGQLGKLINNIVYDINIAALAEILPFAVKLGLKPEQVGKVVLNGSSRSFASQFFVPQMLAGNFHNSYPMASAYKDLITASDLSIQQQTPLPVLSAATATYQTALLKGHGDCDKGGMIKVFEELFGVEFREEKS